MKLREFAKQLGLSATTVSRALSGYPEVAESTRKRVMDEALVTAPMKMRCGLQPGAPVPSAL